MMTPTEFGAILRDRRVSLGLSLVDVERLAQISKSKLARIEVGMDDGVTSLLAVLDLLGGDLWEMRWTPRPPIGKRWR